jgi:hypothetical protein
VLLHCHRAAAAAPSLQLLLQLLEQSVLPDAKGFLMLQQQQRQRQQQQQ